MSTGKNKVSVFNRNDKRREGSVSTAYHHEVSEKQIEQLIAYSKLMEGEKFEVNKTGFGGLNYIEVKGRLISVFFYLDITGAERIFVDMAKKAIVAVGKREEARHLGIPTDIKTLPSYKISEGFEGKSAIHFSI